MRWPTLKCMWIRVCEFVFQNFEICCSWVLSILHFLKSGLYHLLMRWPTSWECIWIRVCEFVFRNLRFKALGGCLLSQVSTFYDFFQKWVTLFLFAGMIQDLLWKLWWKIHTIPTHHGNHGCHLAMATHDAGYSPPAKIWKPPCRLIQMWPIELPGGHQDEQA